MIILRLSKKDYIKGCDLMRIVMLEPLAVSPEVLDAMTAELKAQGHEFIGYDTRVEETAQLIARGKDADILIIANQPLPGEVIRACSNLKMISVAFTGVDHIDMITCQEKGITVCNAAGYSTHSVAELTLGLMVAVMRNITACNEVVRKGQTKAGLIGQELYGKTVGVVGTGAIGSKVARILRAMDCRVLAYSRTRREEVSKLGVEYVDLDTLLAESDIVTLHVPLTEETKFLIDKERLALMKPTSILINTARGPVVDNKALAEALQRGQLAGAGIDVYDMEPPLPDNYPLLALDNAVLTPHVGFATTEAFYRRAEIVFANIKMWLEGTPQNLVK